MVNIAGGIGLVVRLLKLQKVEIQRPIGLWRLLHFQKRQMKLGRTGTAHRKEAHKPVLGHIQGR